MKRWLPRFALSLALLWPLSALAVDDSGPPPEPPVKVTIFILPHPDVPEETVVAAMRALESGIKRNPRLEYHDLDTRVAEFAQEIPQDQVEAARNAYKDGTKALFELNIPLAVQKLQDAVSGLARVLPFIKKQELADAMARLGVAYYQGGDTKSGRDTFLRLLTWRSDYVYDPNNLPPDFFQSFTDAQKVIDSAKRGSIMITSDPDGAQAYVDGRYVGITPCTAEGLIVGEHYVTFKKEGYKKNVTPATVSSKKELKASATLDRSEKFLLVAQAMKKLGGSLGNDMAPREIDDLKQILFIDHGIFIKAAPKTGDRVQIDTFLYDLRNRRRLSSVTKEVPKDGAEAQLSQIAANLYLGVGYDAELIAPKDAPKPKQLKRQPLYKTWWFWTAAAAVIGVGVATALIVPAVLPKGCDDTKGCFHITE